MNVAFFFLLQIACVLSLTVNRHQPDELVMSPLVRTKSGPIQGREIMLPTARQDVYQFTAIPYAEPPVGELRFKKPVPKSSWKYIYYATKLPNSCINVAAANDSSSKLLNYFPDEVQQSEDCLYLNLWVPQDALDTMATNGTKLLPVYVFIHGGGFISGTAMQKLYNGTMMSGFNNIIFATIQYRLGSLGFAYFGSENDNDDAPGNVGLWDQLEALKWISENIAAFGGNCSEITIGGEGSVTYHLLSPYSRKYFQRAIIESGSATAPGNGNSASLGLEVTNNVLNQIIDSGDVTIDCSEVSVNESTIADKLKCLRSVDAVLIAKTDAILMSNGFAGPLPVVDGDFVPRDPADMLLSGDFNEVPLLIGTNKDEGSLSILNAVPQANELFPSDDNPTASLDSLNYTHYVDFLRKLMISVSPKQQQQQQQGELNDIIFKTIQLLYWPPGNQGFPSGAKILNALIQAAGDYSITCPTLTWASVASLFLQDIPTYVYHFTYRSRSSTIPAWMGAIHGEEMRYIFGEPFAPHSIDYEYCKDEKILSLKMMEYWGNFIKFGDPNVFDQSSNNKRGRTEQLQLPKVGRGNGLLRKWPPYNAGENCKYQVNELSVLKQVLNYGEAVTCGFKIRECLFWSELFPKLVQLTSTKNAENVSN